jgi:hypothetical protein
MDKTTKPPEPLFLLPLEVRAEMAFNTALEKVIEEHSRLGLSLPIWHDGKVVEISAEQLRNQP